MAKRGTLEVEHLLWTCRNPSKELADGLEAVAKDMGWERGVGLPNVPFGGWVAVAVKYCREGYDGLVKESSEPKSFRFVLGLLEHIPSTDSLMCLEQILLRDWGYVSQCTDRSRQFASALNLVCLSKKPAVNASAIDENRIRQFLEGQLLLHPEESARAGAMCALRFFGNDHSVVLIQKAVPMQEHWEPVRGSAIRAIRKRLRTSAE